jgi:H+/gluconate symporter-like permease
MRGSSIALLVFALWLSAGVAHADVDPDPPTKPVAAEAAKGGHRSRHLMYAGLLAALFLVVAGAAGKNDKAGKGIS